MATPMNSPGRVSNTSTPTSADIAPMKAGIIWHVSDHTRGVSLGVLRSTSRRSDEAQEPGTRLTKANGRRDRPAVSECRLDHREFQEHAPNLLASTRVGVAEGRAMMSAINRNSGTHPPVSSG